MGFLHRNFSWALTLIILLAWTAVSTESNCSITIVDDVWKQKYSKLVEENDNLNYMLFDLQQVNIKYVEISFGDFFADFHTVYLIDDKENFHTSATLVFPI